VAFSKLLLTPRGWGLFLLIAVPALVRGTEWSPPVALPERSLVQMQVSNPLERLELMVNTSRILTLKQSIPRLFVSNPLVLKATPLSPNQVQVSGLKAGSTQVNLWDDQGAIYTLDVIVLRDVTELLGVLQSEFPEANLRIRPLAESIYVTGYVPRPEMVGDIIRLAEDYHKKVINGISVGGVHQVALHVKVMEVSRTKLRDLGLDWQYFGQNVGIEQGVGGIVAGAGAVPGMGGETVRFSIVGDSAAFTGYLSALREHNLVKLLSEPTLIAMTGRPASFSSGGRFPILVPSGLGTTSVQFENYGTRVDFVPVVLGNGHIRLEVRPTISELDVARGVEVNGTRVPALTERSVDTAVEMRAGQTLALAGLIQNRIESRNRGVPYLGDLPFVGRAFSRVQEHMNEVELLVTVTPELIAPLEPHQVPLCGPGQLTVSPDDRQLFLHGHVEVPHCGLFVGPPVAIGPEEYAPSQGALYPISHSTSVDVAPRGGSPPAASARPSVEPAAWQRSPPATRHSLIGPIGYDPLP
jgi:pilus assembly protein CpaC